MKFRNNLETVLDLIQRNEIVKKNKPTFYETTIIFL